MMMSMHGSFSSPRFSGMTHSPIGAGELPVAVSFLEAYASFRRRSSRQGGMSGARFDSQSEAAQTAQLDSALYRSARFSEAKKREEFNRQWRERVLLPDAPLTANALTETAKPVFEALLELGDWAIDLSGLCPSEVNGVHLAVILRATLRHKQTTKGWESALEVARQALRLANVDERKVLSGLVKK